MALATSAYRFDGLISSVRISALSWQSRITGFEPFAFSKRDGARRMEDQQSRHGISC